MKSDIFIPNNNSILDGHRVSIVIPVYNSEKYLRDCLDSIINQSYKDLEIICVNDGSSDNSFEILEEYSLLDSRIRVFSKTNEGKGAASARNLGLKNATGDFIQFLDSDDFFESDMIEVLVNKARSSEADVVICRGKSFDDEKKCVIGNLAHPDLCYAPDKPAFNWRDCPEYICEIADNYAWNKLFKRQLLNENNLTFTPIPISDDQDISMIAPIVAKRVAVIDRAFINYRVGTGSSQCDSQTRHPEAAYEGVFSVVKRLRKMGVYDEVKQSYLNVAIRLMREYFDRMTEYSKAKQLYEKYRNEIFPFLDAVNLPINYFHDRRVGEWYTLITSKSLEEIFFEAARASGGTMTTAPLRFQVPYEKIKRNSKIVLIGKGIAGRYWYSQLILSNHCEVVYWTDSDEHIPQNLNFEEVIRVTS